MFAAANGDLPLATRRAARQAAEGIQADIVTRVPALALPDGRRREIAREGALWRFIYTFARLDQQPGGSWSRSIVQWMNEIWAGDHDEIYRDPNMRRRGGTDLTCYAVDGLVGTLRAHLTPVDTAEVLVHNEAVRRAFRELAGKLGFKGGSGTGMPGAAAADVKIRHTAMTVIAALRYRQGHDRAVSATHELRRCLTYLAEDLSHWSVDRAFPFGMAMACAKLAELLGTDLVDHLEPALVTDVRAKLEQELPTMIEALESQPDHVRYLPPPPSSSCHPRPPFFQPYCNFWRMERSGFLMYVGFAVQEDGRALIELVGKHLGRRFVQCFNELLADVAPFDPTAPEASLIRFHRGDESVPRDWGLTGELTALLELPAVQELIVDGDPARRRDLDAKRSALRAGLLATFDSYSEHTSLFAYAQGASILRAWQVFGTSTVTRRDLDALDASIDRLRNQQMTEWDLDQHIRQCVVHPAGDPSTVDVDSIRELLVAKLESGEYIESDAAWEAIASKAALLDARCSESLWRPSASDPAVAQLHSLLGSQGENLRRALDVGDDYDPGAFGDHLAGWGFRVARLRLSAHGAGAEVITPPDGSPSPSRAQSSDTYDVVTAGEAMLRVPKGRVAAVCQELHRLIRPGGLLMVSIRTKDHALIDLQGRFVQFYRDDLGLRQLLRRIGFENPIVLQSGTSPWVSLFARRKA
jgi:hypothetical protein